ncbi:MAG: transposase [Gammaproteobacteria bacterium]
MKQQTLGGFEKFGKTTRRAQFLAEMDRLVPWRELGEAIEPIYPKGAGEAGGRPPVPLERMLRIHFLQLWFNLSDPAVEEALYDSASMRSFAGIDSAPNRFRTRLRCASFATCSSATAWARFCSRR